ncbi:protein of unknown function [Aminobacter niigataensis]|nr:protein of unknown function [Aminobacter niigataensis]
MAALTGRGCVVVAGLRSDLTHLAAENAATLIAAAVWRIVTQALHGASGQCVHRLPTRSASARPWPMC